MALQIAPLRTDSAQHAGIALLIGHLEGLGQWCLVVNEQRNEHIVVTKLIGHARIGPHGSLHLATVHAAEAGEVDEYRLSLGTGGCHALFIVGKSGFDSLGILVEILCVDGRGEGAHGLAGSSPESGNHIDGKGKRDEATHDAEHRHGLMDVATNLVFLELQPTHEVSTQQTKNDDPQRQEHLTVEQVPAIGKVGHGEEFQCESQLNEAQHNLNSGHP